MNVIIIALLFFLQLFLFFATGSILFRLFGIKEESFTLILFSGFLAFFCLFGIIAIPMILTLCSLSVLTCTITVISVIILAAGILLLFKNRRTLSPMLKKSTKGHSYMFLPLLFMLFIQQLTVFNHIDWSADACYYIGKVSTDVYTNTMGQYDPYTGAALSALDSRRLFACFQEYNAAITQLFHIHPLKQAKLVMPQLLILLTSITYYHIGLELFQKNKKKADLFVCFVILLDLFSNTIYTNATFLMTRTYEGKSILANLIIPGLFYCFLLMWKKEKHRLCTLLILLLSYSSCIFTSSSMMIVPVGLTAGMIPQIIKERKWKELPFYFICILPNMLVCVIYLLTSKGLLKFVIGG